MDGPAHIGVELPCYRSVPPESCLLVLLEQQPIHLGAPRAGRLCTPRKVVREVEGLLRHYTGDMREKARQLGLRDPSAARALLDSAKAWATTVRQQHLAPHRVRVPITERFKAFDLPEAARLQLLRQLLDKQCPPEPRILLCVVVPITPCMRLLDKVAVYLHAPVPMRKPYCTGPWWPVPEQHVQAALVGLHVVVLVG